MASSVTLSNTDSKSKPENGLDLSLPECFDLAFKVHQDLETTDESTSSDSNQGKLREATLATEKAIEMVNNLQLFSRNEDIDEVATNEVKYMLLSAYLGYFSGLNTHMPRKEAVLKSQLCYKDFLRLLKLYSVIDHDVNVLGEDGDEEDQENKAVVPQLRRQDLNTMAAQRNNKIQRFKQKKEMEKKLTELKVLVEREHVDDEVKREFYLTQLKHWANLAIDEIENCSLELQMLKHRDEMTRKGHDPSVDSKPKPKPFGPFILTKNAMQKEVFGAGYPALPTMTVDEFYEQKLKEGTLSESVQGGHSMQEWAMNPEKDAADREREEAEKESLVEADDPESLQRARAMDEWKDDHRRGDGNRHNKG